MLNDQLLEEFMHSFYGYGNLKSKIWFIGMEEGGGNDIEEVAARLKCWENLGKPTLMDVAEFHNKLAEAHNPSISKYFSDKNIRYQRTWGGLIKMIYSSQNNLNANTEDRKNYQALKFARISSAECLLELYPLPSPGLNRFNYNGWSRIPYLKSRKDYKDFLRNTRTEKIKSLIASYKPSVVVFYSSSQEYLNAWSDISHINFGEISADIVEGTSGKKLIIKSAKTDATLYIVTHHPVYRNLNSSYFERVGALIRDYITKEVY